MNGRPAILVTLPCLLAALAGACVTEGGISEPSPMPVTEVVDVRTLGDGFVRTGERRIPVETFVLEMRQHTRALGAAASLGVRVDIVVDEGGGEAAGRAADYLLEQLQIMGVRNARVAFR